MAATRNATQKSSDGSASVKTLPLKRDVTIKSGEREQSPVKGSRVRFQRVGLEEKKTCPCPHREKAGSEVASDFLSLGLARRLVNTWLRCFRRIKQARDSRDIAKSALLISRLLMISRKRKGVCTRGMSSLAASYLGRSDATPRGDITARKDSFLTLLVSGIGLLKIHYSYKGIDRRYPLGNKLRYRTETWIL